MARRFFYTSPVDFENPGDWKALAKRLRQAATKSCGSDSTIDMVATPRFAPLAAEPLFDGAPAWAPNLDTGETLLAIADEEIGPRTVRIEPWSTYPGHAVVCVTVGGSILRKERRELLRSIPKATKRQCALLYEHERIDAQSRYDVDAARVQAYQIDLDTDQGRSTLEAILAPIDEPFYLCERWLLHGEGGRVDEERFTIYREFGPEIVQCSPNLELDDEAQDAARIHLWSTATRGAGLLALYPDDPNLEGLARTFLATETHLQPLLAHPSTIFRVAIARTHPQLVVCHDSYWEGGDPVFIV
ncbi:MAG: hypothetical protein AAGC60_29715 [Acidobacteriota bacterium]